MEDNARSIWLADQKPLPGKIGDAHVVLYPKEFSTGSLGWYGNGKVTIQVGDIAYPCQASICITIIGTKKLREAQKAPVAPKTAAAIFGGQAPPKPPEAPDGAILGQETPSEQPSNGKARRRKKDVVPSTAHG